MVEEVVELGAELDLQALDRSIEVFVQGEIRLVESWCPTRVARSVAERTEHIACRILDRWQHKSRIVNVIHIAGVRRSRRPPLRDFLPGT